MKKNLFLPFLLFFISSISCLFAQGFQPPAEDKAVIYFVRVTSVGFAIPFEFFHQDEYIGAFAGKNYIRYEADSGAHLFWASSENKEFLTADLKANETYIVIVDVGMGFGIARVGLTPLNYDNIELFERAEEIISKKAPKNPSEDEKNARNTKLEDFIAEKLQKYHEKWKNEKDFKHLSVEMAIPTVALKN